MNKIDKILIRQRFMRGASTYASQATVQRTMAGELVRQLTQNTGVRFSKILEIGCGCGLLSKNITADVEYDLYVLNDLVEDYSHLTDKIPNSKFISGDIETTDFTDKPFDLVTSSSTFQWMEDLPKLFKRIAGDLLKDGGVLAFTTFGPDNLIQLKQTAQAGLDYLSMENVCQLVDEHFEILHASESRAELTLENPQAVLRHLQRTGVTGISRQSWTKTRLQNFIKQYSRQFSTPNGVYLTYHPITIIARNS